MQQFWNATRRELKRQLGDALFETHFDGFAAIAMDENSITIATHDEMAAILVDKNYRELVQRCAEIANGRPIEVCVSSTPLAEAPAHVPVPEVQPQLSLFDALFAAPEAPAQQSMFGDMAPAASPAPVFGDAPAAHPHAAHAAHAQPAAAPAHPQSVAATRPAVPAPSAARAPKGFSPPRSMTSASTPLPRRPAVDLDTAIYECGLNPKFHLNSFVVGTANEFAYEAARAVIDQPGSLYNPLFLYGGVGLGKTHLMNAIGLGILANDPSKRVRYISAETFANELIESIGAKRMDEFRQRSRIDLDVLLIDDIQFIAGKERTQEEFFHTFNALYQSGRQIVLTSDRIPQEMPELEERLMSRLNMGLIADVQPPDLETRIAMLRNKSVELGYEVPGAVLEYIAQQVRSNVRELHGALLRIGGFARMLREPISLSLAQTQLERVHRDRTASVSPELILKMTAETFGVSVKELKGKKRARTISTPRKVAMFLARSHTGASYPELGTVFGGRDHTTVMSAVRSVEQLLAKGDPIRHRIEAIERRLS